MVAAGNEVDQKRKVCNDLQRMWMSTQTELVKLSNEAAMQSEKVGEMKSQAAVLTQKRVRVEGQVRLQQGEIGACIACEYALSCSGVWSTLIRAHVHACVCLPIRKQIRMHECAKLARRMLQCWLR
jgi:hypothetical protein